MALLVIAAICVAAWLWFQSPAAPVQPSPIGSPVPPVGSGPLVSFANAIYQFEGGGGSNATNGWNNNPGNIGGGQATYPTQQAGWDALYSYILNKAQANPQWSFYDFFSNYLGTPGQLGTTAQGNATDYANYVASSVGADPNQSVWGFLNGSNS